MRKWRGAGNNAARGTIAEIYQLPYRALAARQSRMAKRYAVMNNNSTRSAG